MVYFSTYLCRKIFKGGISMKKFLLLIWELPQKIVAKIVIKLSRAEKISTYKDATLYYWKWSGGMSLSNSIFVPFEWIDGSQWQSNYIKHEYGHSIQSKILGPLYLLIIGLPSLLWAWLGDNYRKKNNKSYYWFYTEKWANKLGGAKYNE
jgi:hypothetical protein